MDSSSTFLDHESGDEAYWSARPHSDGVALSLAVSSGVDLDLLLDFDTARELASAILAACQTP